MELNKNQLLAESIIEGFCRQSEKSRLIDHIDIVHLNPVEKSEAAIVIGCDIEIYVQFAPIEGMAPVKGMSANQICLDAHIDFKDCYYNEELGGYEWHGCNFVVDENIHVFYGSGHSPNNAVWRETKPLKRNQVNNQDNNHIVKSVVDNVFGTMSESETIDFHRALFEKTVGRFTENLA